jgi:hypothetical protein
MKINGFGLPKGRKYASLGAVKISIFKIQSLRKGRRDGNKPLKEGAQ